MRKHIGQSIVGFIILFPLVFLLILSFGKQWFYPHILPNIWQTSQWESLFSPSFQLTKSLGLSLLLSISVGLVSTITAFYFSKKIAYSYSKTTWLSLAYVPYLLSPIIFAVLIHFYFLKIGLSGSLFGVIIAQFLICFPFGIIICSTFWTSQIQSLENLSSTLGGSTTQTLKRVLLPLAKSTLLLCFFQCFLISWFEYGLTHFIGAGKVKTLTVSVFAYVNEANPFLAALAGFLLILPSVLLLLVNKRLIFKTSKKLTDYE
jgi:putative spermidine/putrescine transport system permease protein